MPPLRFQTPPSLGNCRFLAGFHLHLFIEPRTLLALAHPDSLPFLCLGQVKCRSFFWAGDGSAVGIVRHGGPGRACHALEHRLGRQRPAALPRVSLPLCVSALGHGHCVGDLLELHHHQFLKAFVNQFFVFSILFYVFVLIFPYKPS